MTDKATLDAMPDGLHQLSWPDYFALNAASRSLLRAFDRSPAHAYDAMMNPRQSAAFDMGSALHAAILEPSTVESTYSARPPGIDGRTNAGKAALAEWQAESVGKILLPQPDAMETLRGAANAVLAHPLARELVEGPGMTEMSAIWTDPQTGVRCKSRHDRIKVLPDGVGASVDVKSTEDASPRGMARSVVKFGYDLQSGMYLESLDRAVGEAIRTFIIIAVEKSPPYAVAVYELDTAYIERGRRMFRDYLDGYAACMKSGIWPKYSGDIEVLEAPEWIVNQM